MKAAALALVAAFALGQPANYKGTGTVVAVDRDMRRVTIEADPIEALNLPALALAFNVYDERIWNRVYRGRHVEFEFIKQGNNYVLLRVLKTN
jgi:Cu(I)/Ag(I) efflux system periplasmic protein CusF